MGKLCVAKKLLLQPPELIRKLELYVRDGKLCDSVRDWNTRFQLNYPDCGEHNKWAAENNFLKYGCMGRNE